jgi:hypothetical protein
VLISANDHIAASPEVVNAPVVEDGPRQRRIMGDRRAWTVSTNSSG